ncbi:MAG: DUF2207 domain-containing protein [Bacteroidaceae bacterium]|nr:DUF2207 domain-containing protein [Bacteroidaceae bacterium]
MRNHRSLLFIVLLIAAIAAKADRGGFYYKNYRFDAVVHQDNVWEVTETIDVFFEEPRHGIYRYIPLTFSLEHDVSKDEGMEQRVNQGQVVQDWRKFNYKSEVEDFKVDGWEYSTEDGNDRNWVVRIGSSSKEVTGEQRYVIHYKYVYREDRRPDYDYIFHTILGTDFNEPIENFSFRIEFEKPLPANIQKLLEVYSGAYGDKKNAVENLTIKATKNVITGKAINIPPNHGITIYAKLPEGYYEGARSVNHVFHYIAFSITLMLIVLIIFYLFKTKRNIPTKVIEFYPPDDISSAEVGTIIDGSVDSIDIASMIPWLAGQGYISIKEEEQSALFGKKTETTLTKLKDLPKNAPTYQKKIMKILFGNGDTADLNHLGEQPSAVEGFKKALKDSFKGERKLSSYKWAPLLLYVALLLSSTCMLGTNSVIEDFDLNEWVFAVGLWACPFVVGAAVRLYDSSKDLFGSKWKRFLTFIVKALVMAAICFFYSQFVTYGSPFTSWMVVALFVICFLLCEFIGRFNVDTDYRVQMIGRLLGFKEFIKTAEKSRLESLQQEDPAYFYKVLPYAMVFDLSKKWAKLFKDIEVEKPDWYETNTPLMGHALTSHMTSSLYSSTSNAINIISHDSSSSGSSGGGGGGFSGGGGGGGGGGSW